MAIGSEGEIGVKFGMWKDMTETERQAWWEYMRAEWSSYLMNGYATLVHNLDNNPIYTKQHEKK